MGDRGFTLIELSIVIGLVVMAALIVVPAIEGAIGVKTREEAGKVAGAIRAMYGEAALSSRTCRLVFDLDEGAWWPECADGKVRVSRMEEAARGARVEEQVNLVFGTEEQEAARKELAARKAFSSFESGLAPKVDLPDGLSFEGVWTQHQPETYTKGKAYLYFFPQGQTEAAYVYLGDGSDTYTIRVDPMSGRTKVDAEKLAVPDRLVQR